MQDFGNQMPLVFLFGYCCCLRYLFFFTPLPQGIIAIFLVVSQSNVFPVHNYHDLLYSNSMTLQQVWQKPEINTPGCGHNAN